MWLRSSAMRREPSWCCAGKQHKNVMRAIRNMEPAWEKVQGLKFQLLSGIYNLPNGGKKEVPSWCCAGKQHKNVMEAIRKMEPAWTKTCGSNFRLTFRTVIQPNVGTREVPCYSLTKTQIWCLSPCMSFQDNFSDSFVKFQAGGL